MTFNMKKRNTNCEKSEDGFENISEVDPQKGDDFDFFNFDAARDNNGDSIKRINIIKEAVINTFDISLEDLDGNSRVRAIVEPRQVAMFLSHALTNASFSEIGESFNKDHSTILHSCYKIEQKLSTDSSLKQEIQDTVNNLCNLICNQNNKIRNSAQIDEFLNIVGNEWSHNAPDMRFGQLMINFNTWHEKAYGIDIFYLEETEFLIRLKDFLHAK